MTLPELDALIGATPGAAMILLVEGDWRTQMGPPATTAARRDQEGRIAYGGLPVGVLNLGASRVLTGEPVRTEKLAGLTAP